MDVLACRKTAGRVEGQIWVSCQHQHPHAGPLVLHTPSMYWEAAHRYLDDHKRGMQIMLDAGFSHIGWFAW